MGSHWDQIKSYSGLTAIVSLYGIASLLVVFLGPSMGLGLSHQIIIIALLLLTWPLAVLVMHFRTKRRERREAKESAAAGPTTGELSSSGRPSARSASRVPSRVYGELARGVEEVVQWLRGTKLSSVRRKDPVYSLPWFLVAGAHGSGKTSLLLSSGLDFHALPSQRRSDQNLIRPTRDVDWRVTDWCVLLDSTGRYQTEGPDGEEWAALVETITKYRKRRPIDGLVIAADAGTLLGSSETEIEQQAKILRSRLDQLNSQVQARFPVYLVFTHADSMDGFDEFFRLPDSAERGQVWGTTIPLEHSASAHALFDVEFDTLFDTLMRYRLLRLNAQESAAEQLLVFDFPLRFAEARRRLGLFTSALFRPNPFSESPLLRGFYFTNSAPAHRSGPDSSAAQEPLETVAIAGEGCFSERLFNDVLLRDKDLAASFQQGKRNPARLQNALLGVAAAVVLFFVVGLIVSVTNNLSLIDEARRTGSRVAAYSKDIQSREGLKDYASTHAQLQDVDRLREMLIKLDEFDRDWPPFYFKSLLHRFGLYSGRSISPYLRAIYFESINQRFFKPTVAELEADLKAFNPESPPPPAAADSTATATPALSAAEAAEERLGQYYDLLKVYLMLSRYPERAVPSLLIERLGDHWTELAPPEDEALALGQLVFFANAVALDDAPHINAREETVRASCVKLESFGPINRYYKRAIDEISSTTKEVALSEIVGGRKGVIEGTARVKGAFTTEGYKKMLVAIKEAETGIREEDWVCPNAPTSNDQRDISKVKAQYARQYSRQYIDAWRKFLKDAKVAEYTTDGAAKTLDELSKNDSPLERVLSEVAKQTNLFRPSSFWARINPFAPNKSEAGSTIAKAIEDDFQTVIKFVSGEGGIGQYRQVLTDVRNVLNEDAAIDDWSQLAKRFLQANDPKSLSKFESLQRPLLQAVKGETGVGVEAVSLLEQPLGNLRKLLLASNVDQMEREWREKLQPAAQRLEQGYPFAAPSAPDAPLTEVAKFLNPADGQLWAFYKLNLDPYFTEADGQFKLKEGSKIKLSDSFINYLNKARRLSDALFPQNGKSPGFTFGLTLQRSQSGNATVELQVEGKRIDASAPPLNIVWAGSSGAAITVFQGIGQPQSKQYSGWWAVFRMFEEGGGMSARTSDNQYALAWNVQGTTVRAKLQPPGTTNNPFDLKLFRELRTPQSTQ